MEWGVGRVGQYVIRVYVRTFGRSCIFFLCVELQGDALDMCSNDNNVDLHVSSSPPHPPQNVDIEQP